MGLILTEDEQGIVVFHIWKSLPYKTRMFLSYFLIIIGIIIQIYGALGIGLIFIIGGNSLLLVKGYDNRIKLGKFSASGEWIKSDKEHLHQIIEMNKKLSKWDRSIMDISNPLGTISFIFIVLFFGILYLYALADWNYSLELISIDALVLLLPHWFSGMKRISTTPLLLRKIAIFNKILKEFDTALSDKKINFMIYVKGKDKKLPQDVKMKIDFPQQAEEFMGLYAQISLNNVQGNYYPYFYVVLVAKPELKILDKYYDKINIKRPLIKEKTKQDNLEIIIIRQFTTKTGGYHTKTKTIGQIFSKGIKAAQYIIDKEKTNKISEQN